MAICVYRSRSCSAESPNMTNWLSGKPSRIWMGSTDTSVPLLEQIRKREKRQEPHLEHPPRLALARRLPQAVKERAAAVELELEREAVGKGVCVEERMDRLEELEGRVGLAAVRRGGSQCQARRNGNG